MGAAERAAAELREQAEMRARERIAEADRAAENRVQAAEEEAEELIANARSQAADHDETRPSPRRRPCDARPSRSSQVPERDRVRG